MSEANFKDTHDAIKSDTQAYCSQTLVHDAGEGAAMWYVTKQTKTK